MITWRPVGNAVWRAKRKNAAVNSGISINLLPFRPQAVASANRCNFYRREGAIKSAVRIAIEFRGRRPP